MSKAVKALVAETYRKAYEGVNSACVVDMTGLKVLEQESLRAMLREKSAMLKVVKTSQARVAFSGGPLAALGDSLEGPCALVTAPDSVVDAAKVLVDARKEFIALTLKQAILEGDPSLLTVEELSKMKSWAELMGEIGMLTASPGRALAACLKSPQSKIAGCLKSIIDKAA